MQKVKFSEIKSELIANMQSQTLIPIFGSGFTCDCKSCNGHVPSGKQYKDYMIVQLEKMESFSESESSSLKTSSFSDISTYYQKIISKQEQNSYLKDNFTNVKLESFKRDILSFPWQYIYTLNIDDGIERNSDYKRVICANRKVNKEIFNSDKCVIKLHGDVEEILSYEDSAEIFSSEQYVSSLRDNIFLLDKLKHDSQNYNLLFIGCSLSDEIDLIYSLGELSKSDAIVSRYCFGANLSNKLEEIKYEKYGITHYVEFSSYDEMYKELFCAEKEALSIRNDELKNYHISEIDKISNDYCLNKSFWFDGKSLRKNEGTLYKPYFFVERVVCEKIVNNMEKCPVQILLGSGCSGKTYVLAAIAYRIKNKTVYFFETKDRISDESFKSLLNYENKVILADSSFFTYYQIEQIVKNAMMLKHNKTSIVIVVPKNDRDIQGIIKLCEMNNIITNNDLININVDNRFSDTEIEKINPLLTSVEIGIVEKSKTIVDNIIETSRKLLVESKYQKVNVNTSSYRHIAALIALATEKKIYTTRAIELDIDRELNDEVKLANPLIDRESTWQFERSNGDNPPTKYVINAQYWLYEQLKFIAKSDNTHERIVKAYEYIVSKILSAEGKLDLMRKSSNSAYKEYILFDNINQIFYSDDKNGQKSLELIRQIYDNLSNQLSTDPNFMHQQAKCYIKLSYYEHNKKIKIEYLEKAYRNANVASSIFQARFAESHSDKLLISIAHVDYTSALIRCHICRINQYEEIDDNSRAIKEMYKAFSSPYNTYEYAKSDTFNYGNAIHEMINKSMDDISLVDSEACELLGPLFLKIK